MHLPKALRLAHPFTIAFYFLTFFLISSKELLWLRLFVDRGSAQLVITVAFVFYFLALFVFFLPRSSSFMLSPILRIRRDHTIKPCLLLFVATCAYLLLHEIYFDDGGRSLKYCVYWLFFLTLLTENIDFPRVAKWVVAMTGVMSFALLLQAILILCVADPTTFPPLSPASVDGRIDDVYVNPFGLGLVTLGSLVTYGPVSFYRASSIATEPKYCSLVLWAGLLAWCYLRVRRKFPSLLWIGLLGAGFFICHAYVSAAVVVIGLLIEKLGKRVSIGSVCAAIVGLLGAGIYAIWVNRNSFEGYLKQRVSAFLETTIKPLEGIAFQDLGWLGVGFDSSISSARVPGIVTHLIRYGYIGLILQSGVLLFFFKCCLDGLRDAETPGAARLFALALAVVLAYLVFFMPEFITPLFGFIFAVPFVLRREMQLSAPAEGSR